MTALVSRNCIFFLPRWHLAWREAAVACVGLSSQPRGITDERPFTTRPTSREDGGSHRTPPPRFGLESWGGGGLRLEVRASNLPSPPW